MQNVFNVEELQMELKKGQSYYEFLRVPSMSAGIYQLKKDGIDKQEPHTEDEIYYVIEGKAEMFVGEKNIEVKQGSIIFVDANIEHRFHTIEEDLTILVLFSPAEHTSKV
jgi:mannose-6-phosphate isomerase-like protein (cupin superfamily)